MDSIDLQKLSGITLNDNNSRLLINYDENKHGVEIKACSIVIIQILFSLSISSIQNGDKKIKFIVSELKESITTKTKQNLSEIIENVSRITSVLPQKRIKNNSCFAITLQGVDWYTLNLIKLNNYLNGLWLKLTSYDDRSTTYTIDRTEIYTANNLIKDIHKWCMDFTSKYLKLSQLFIDEHLPLLLNALQSITFLKSYVLTQFMTVCVTIAYIQNRQNPGIITRECSEYHRW